MSRYTDRAKELRAIVEPHYNCAQSVLIPYAEALGLGHESARDLAACFGSGMKMGSVCGAFTGGLMALGLFGVSDNESVERFREGMKANHDGVVDCAELLRRNEEAGGDRKVHCNGLVLEAVALVEEILKSKGKLPEEG